MSQLTVLFFFFNDTATTEIYTLSLHDALPISAPGRGSSSSWLAPCGSERVRVCSRCAPMARAATGDSQARSFSATSRSEEHTSELQSQSNLVCRLLLEKKKNNTRLDSNVTTT